MQRFLRFLRPLFAALVVAACTPARTGVIGNTLTTNVRPHISITGLAPLRALAHGRFWVAAATHAMTTTAAVSFDYAVFAGSLPGPLPDPPPSFAYAAIARIENSGQWRFHSSADSSEAFSADTVELGGMPFTAQLLRTGSARDWGSGLWRENGFAVPEYWLAKRWVTHLDNATRAVMEYREPWPECLPGLSSGLPLIGESAYQCLRAFVARADAAFLAERKGGDFKEGEAAPESLLEASKTPPDLGAAMGAIVIPVGGPDA